jgi:hypothetical protein
MATFGYLETDKLVQNATYVEDLLVTALTTLSSQPSAADLLNVQAKMQQWSLLVDLAAQTIKTLSETLKSIVQKSG